jgi:IS30 family transposase
MVAGRSGRLAQEGREPVTVSKSSIYNWIAAGSPHHKDNIRRHLRHGGRKARSSPSGAKISIPNRISIDERPVADPGRLGNGHNPGEGWKRSDRNLGGKEKLLYAHGKT